MKSCFGFQLYICHKLTIYIKCNLQPWHEKLAQADKEGRLVYIQNLDIRFGASEIVVL